MNDVAPSVRSRSGPVLKSDDRRAVAGRRVGEREPDELRRNLRRRHGVPRGERGLHRLLQLRGRDPGGAAIGNEIADRQLRPLELSPSACRPSCRVSGTRTSVTGQTATSAVTTPCVTTALHCAPLDGHRLTHGRGKLIERQLPARRVTACDGLRASSSVWTSDRAAPRAGARSALRLDAEDALAQSEDVRNRWTGRAEKQHGFFARLKLRRAHHHIPIAARSAHPAPGRSRCLPGPPFRYEPAITVTTVSMRRRSSDHSGRTVSDPAVDNDLRSRNDLSKLRGHENRRANSRAHNKRPRSK